MFFNEGFEPGKIFSNFSVPVENDVSFKPRDRHVSWEECNEPERSRLLAELEFFEKLANRLICESNGLSLEHAVAEFYMKVKAQNQEGKLTKAHLKDFEKLIKMANLRHRKNEEAIIEQLGVARRNQHFFNQQLQAVLNGIFYRSLHPHQPFVIYVRENRVSLQHSQTRTRPPSARHPRDIRKEEMFLRGCREKKIRFDSARVTQLELEVVEAENVISYFRHATSHTKLVKLKEPSAEVLKFQEQLSWTNDLFDAFSWTLEGYKTSLHYHNLYEPAHKEMERINLLMAKAGLKIQTKLSVLQYLRNFFLRELKKKDLKWDFNPTVAISETISILKKASAKLLAWQIHEIKKAFVTIWIKFK